MKCYALTLRYCQTRCVADFTLSHLKCENEIRFLKKKLAGAQKKEISASHMFRCIICNVHICEIDKKKLRPRQDRNTNTNLNKVKFL